MEDPDIVKLFFSRSDNAIAEIKEKYGKICYSIIFNILGNAEDSEECVSDLYINLWNTIPPQDPHNLKAYVCRAARNLALKRLEYNRAGKRNSANVVYLSELEESGNNEISVPDNTEGNEENRLGALISSFLRTQKPEQREVFIRHYWFLDPVEKIAKDCSYSQSRVKSMLFRTRNKLKAFLRKEGVDI
ncbi:MAG: sigma-70 family RNA polymerase sigma factor [Ruminococcaceae bacterium]|nr:sigma-70 family RNA polymerase sigma factor [Oscillospiraceae bacterium]